MSMVLLQQLETLREYFGDFEFDLIFFCSFLFHGFDSTDIILDSKTH